MVRLYFVVVVVKRRDISNIVDSPSHYCILGTDIDAACMGFLELSQPNNASAELTITMAFRPNEMIGSGLIHRDLSP